MKMRDMNFRNVTMLVFAALVFLGERGIAEPAATAQPARLCVQVPAGVVATDPTTQFDSAMIKTGIDYIRSVSPGPVDIIHLDDNSAAGRERVIS